MFERAFALAGGSALPPAAAFEALKLDLGAGAGARLRRAFSPVLRHEAALFVTSSSSGPVITLMIDDVDQDTSAQLLTRIRPLLVEPGGRPSESGQVPVLRPRQIAGVEATTLQISPALELTYSVLDNRLAVSTSPAGIRQARSARSSIRDREPFAGALRKRLDRVTSVVFLDPKRLLALGERVGLSDTPGYAALRSSLLQVRALGAVTSSRALSKSAEIFIEVP
jgi:hypothetical protein